MKHSVLLIAFVLVGSAANAACYGSDTFQTCSDSSGNNYTINRFGNTTIMNGSNYQTGSRWSQQSTTLGNTTFHNGRDAGGNNWSTTCTNGWCN